MSSEHSGPHSTVEVFVQGLGRLEGQMEGIGKSIDRVETKVDNLDAKMVERDTKCALHEKSDEIILKTLEKHGTEIKDHGGRIKTLEDRRVSKQMHADLQKTKWSLWAKIVAVVVPSLLTLVGGYLLGGR